MFLCVCDCTAPGLSWTTWPITLFALSAIGTSNICSIRPNSQLEWQMQQTLQWELKHHMLDYSLFICFCLSFFKVEVFWLKLNMTIIFVRFNVTKKKKKCFFSILYIYFFNVHTCQSQRANNSMWQRKSPLKISLQVLHTTKQQYFRELLQFWILGWEHGAQSKPQSPLELKGFRTAYKFSESFKTCRLLHDTTDTWKYWG